MKHTKMKKIMLVIIAFLLMFVEINASAKPTEVDSVSKMPKTLYSISRKGAMINGIFYYKVDTNGLPASCIDYNVNEPLSKKCNIVTGKGLSDKQRAGLAYIIRKYGLTTTKNPTQTEIDGYYMAELVGQQYITGRTFRKERQNPDVIAAAAEAKNYESITVPFTTSLSSKTLNFSQVENYYLSQAITVSDPKGYPGFVMNTPIIKTGTGAQIVNVVGNTFQVKVPATALTPGKTFKVSINVSGKRPYYSTFEYNCGANYQRMITSYVVKNYLNGGTNSLSGQILIENELKIDKRDASGKLIAGAKLTLTGPNNYKEEIITETKTIVKKNLPLGEYCITEAVAPNGYVISKEKKCGDLTTTLTSQSLSITNEKSEVSISKQDIANSEELEGATIEILDEDKKPLDLKDKKFENLETSIKLIEGEGLSWISTTKPNEIKGLPDGVYYLKETLPPDGYTCVDGGNYIKFEMKDGKVKNDGVVMYNELTTVLIDKYEEGSKKPLKGATLKILDENKKEIDLEDEMYKHVKLVDGEFIEGKGLSWLSTGETMEIQGLPIGKYYLVEVSAPKNYEKSEKEIEFEVTMDGVFAEASIGNSLIVKVPETGMSAIGYIFIGGLVFVVGVVVVYFCTKPRNN